MRLSRKLLAPVLALSSVFSGVAGAQEPPKAPLPDAPLPAASIAQVQQPGQPVNVTSPVNLKSIDWTLPKKDDRPLPYDFHAAAFTSSSSGIPMLGDGKIGKLATYFDRHSNDAQFPFDFAMEYPLGGRFSLEGGTLANMRNNTGKEMSDRFTVRQMTGLPDWQTQDLRQAMFGSPVPDYNRHGSNGYGVGFKFTFGPRK